MVFPDGSAYSNDHFSSNSRMASIQDRVLSFFFDLIILAPFASLTLSRLYSVVELSYLGPRQGNEFLLLLFTATVATAVLWISVMTFFLHWRGASPGMLVMKIRVVSLQTGPLRWTQSWLRSTLWVFEFFLLGVPFLEVLGHPQRRGFHDRAAETEVVTLKQQGDLGPHPLETQFIRHLILAFIGAGALWVLLFTARIYEIALRGDLTHNELVENADLCPSISKNEINEFGHSRVDYALAQFLAGEVEESCLLREADFALWSQNQQEQAWAYLAKAFYYHFDKNKSEEYRKLVCPADAEGGACALSKQIEERGAMVATVQTENSWTQKVLQIREESTRGEYQKALEHLQKLSATHHSFAGYSQKQRVKMLWALQEHDKALGAYQNVWSFLGPSDQAELAGWLCLEQTDEDCHNKSYPACENVRETLKQNRQSNATTESVLGVLAENECQHRHDPVLLGLQEILQDNPALGELAMSMTEDSGWSREHRLNSLRHLSFSTGVSKVVQRRAQLALLKLSYDPKDRQQVVKAMESNERRDWNWQKLKMALDKSGADKNRLPASQNQTAPENER